MELDLTFHSPIFDCVVGGRSSIDIPRLEIFDLEEAYKFVLSYGYDLNDERDLEKAWSYHRRAVTFIKEFIVEEGEVLPDQLIDPGQLNDVAFLLIYASSKAPKDKLLQKWSCAILRVMHVYAHIENDIFFEHADQIQEQVLKNFRQHIFLDPERGTLLGTDSAREQIVLNRFETKPFKNTSSSVIKLLTKPQSVALTLMDKMGVRFVTRNVFDSFRVLRFLTDRHIISFPNIMPDQSKNTLYPLNLFFEVIKNTAPNSTNEQIVEALQRKLEIERFKAEFLEKQNDFSSDGYRAVKFICRHLIDLPMAQGRSRFFFPYEIQIMDYDTYVQNLTGPTSHAEYKNRQTAAAKKRVLGP